MTSQNKPMVNTPDLTRVVEPSAYRTFGEWLGAMTSVHGDKARLALAIGAGGQDINGWINGKRPGAEKLRAIAKHFDVEYVDLVAFFDPHVRESAVTYSASSSPELRGVHSVPLKGQLSPTINGGFWMDNNISDVPLGARVLWNETAPELYAYQVLGDDLFPRVRAGEFLVVDPRKACEFGRDVLITSTDGRHAVLQFIGKRGGMVSFQVVGTISKPVTLAERDIATMHLIRSISGPDDLILPP